jgi:hypothetical protein
MQCGLRSSRPAASDSSRGSRCACTSMPGVAAVTLITSVTPSSLALFLQALARTQSELVARLQSGGPAELERLRAEAADLHERLAEATRDRVLALVLWPAAWTSGPYCCCQLCCA